MTTAIGGVWVASMGLVGYSLRPIRWLTRIFYFTAGMLLLIPSSLLPGESVTTYMGIGLTVLLVLRDRLAARLAAPKSGAGSATAGR